MNAELQAGIAAHVERAPGLYSQVEEDSVLDYLTERLQIDRGTFVEIGVGSGHENNTRRLAANGWTGLWLGDEPIIYAPDGVRAIQTTVTPENVAGLVAARAPVDVFSLDIDGNDYWVGKVAIPLLDPTIIVVEYCHIAPVGWIMPYTAGFRWHRGLLCGAALDAWVDLLGSLGYELGYTTAAQVNAVFVKQAVLSSLACAEGR